ncbi:hypothetical protein [Paenibacillus sp. yr247]|uniref:hypothetical protein n=1 Tax=Paenibacillus sp. yr247 TaxID=1761880 RepID=UPI0015871FE9|nr:hypothetical protein [Paenibacillus sp. yr247]
MQQEENSTIFVAEDTNKLVRYMDVIGGIANRNKHSAYLVRIFGARNCSKIEILIENSQTWINKLVAVQD